jgi:hypothetical protein
MEVKRKIKDLSIVQLKKAIKYYGLKCAPITISNRCVYEEMLKAKLNFPVLDSSLPSPWKVQFGSNLNKFYQKILNQMKMILVEIVLQHRNRQLNRSMNRHMDRQLNPQRHGQISFGFQFG